MSPSRTLRLEIRCWPLREPFVIARQTLTETRTLHVRLGGEEGVEGQGEAAGLDYAGETPETMLAQLEALQPAIEAGLTRAEALDLLPAGGARHALDAALWDLEAKGGGIDPFTRAGVFAAPVASAVTLGIHPAPALEAAARRAAGAGMIKLKVGRDDPLAAVRLVRSAAPDARLMVDANQAWSVARLHALAPALAELGVELLEQPIPVGAEAELGAWDGPIPLCADEACDGEDDLPRLKAGFAAVNIKLDKAGGLTAALRLADAAQAAGFGLMVGCMLGPSLSIAPAMVLAQRCRWIDLDAPPFLARDDDPGFRFTDGRVERSHLAGLWG